MKIRFNELPDGFELRNGEIVQIKQSGGSTGDQKDYSLVTTSKDGSIEEDIKPNYSMTSVSRDEANIEAEGGETVLADLNGDGSFNLYDIKGPRHNSGGVPLFLPEQSFVFSDFSKMKFTKDEMAEMGVESKKKLTPAKISKKYGTNEYNALLKDPYVDDIQANTAELMLDKNKRKLSKLSFMQEAKKDFEDGVPVTSFPFLVEQGQDPIEYTQQVEQITRQKAEQKFIESLPPEQQMQIAAMQQYMAQVDQQQQQEQQGAQDQGMLPQQQGMQQGMQQMPQDMSQQGMMPPPPEMDNQQLAQMGFEVEDMSYAQTGTETSLKSAAEQFQQKDNENLLKERIIYRLNEHINKERKGRDADDFTEKTQDKIKKLINILSTNDISSKDLKALEDDIIKDLPIDQWSSVLGRRINRVSNYINQKYKDNTVNIDEEPDVDDEWNPAVDKLDKVTARSSNRKYIPSDNLNVINQRNVSNKESLPNIQNADILPINLDLSNVQGTTNVSEVDEDLYTNREYFPTNNLRTVGPGQIDNPVNPFNALQDFIPQEEVQLPEKTINWEELQWKDIPGDYTDKEKESIFNWSYKDDPDIFEDSDKGNKSRTYWLNKANEGSRFIKLEDIYRNRGYKLTNELSNYLYDIAERGDNNYNLSQLDEEIFEATGQRPEGNTSTPDQSPQTSGDYRDKIIDYEFMVIQLARASLLMLHSKKV
jgi:hypothetical protein